MNLHCRISAVAGNPWMAAGIPPVTRQCGLDISTFVLRVR